MSGLDLLLAYWKVHHDVLEAAMPALGLPTLVVDQRTGDWPAHWREREVERWSFPPPAPAAGA